MPLEQLLRHTEYLPKPRSLEVAVRLAIPERSMRGLVAAHRRALGFEDASVKKNLTQALELNSNELRKAARAGLAGMPVHLDTVEAILDFDEEGTVGIEPLPNSMFDAAIDQVEGGIMTDNARDKAFLEAVLTAAENAMSLTVGLDRGVTY